MLTKIILACAAAFVLTVAGVAWAFSGSTEAVAAAVSECCGCECCASGTCYPGCCPCSCLPDDCCARGLPCCEVGAACCVTAKAAEPKSCCPDGACCPDGVCCGVHQSAETK
jgi:hypothetical protein